MPSRQRIEVEIRGDMAAGPALKSLRDHLGQTDQAAAKAQSGLSKLGGFVATGMGIAAGLGVFSALRSAIGGIGESIQQASNLAESVSKMSVVFGPATKAIEEFTKDSAKNMGLSRQEAIEMAATFGNLFVTMGLGQKDAADMSSELLQLGADLASFNNIRVDDALQKLRAGLVGEAEPLRALGVLLTEDAVKLAATKMGLKAVGGEFTQAQKVQARFNIILGQTKTAQGDFARTAEGLANATRIQTAEMKNLQAMLGERLLPIQLKITDAQLKLGGAFAKLIESGSVREAARELAQFLPSGLQGTLLGIGGGIDKIREFAGNLIGNIAPIGLELAGSFAKDIADNIAHIAGAFNVMAEGVKELGRAAWDKIKEGIESLKGKLPEGTSDALEDWATDAARFAPWATALILLVPKLAKVFGLLAAGIGRLLGLGLVLLKVAGLIGIVTTALWGFNEIMNRMGGWQQIFDAVGKGAEQIGEELGVWGKNLGIAFSVVMDELAPGVKGALTGVQKIFDTALPALGRQFFGWVPGALKSLGYELGKIGKVVGDALGEAGKLLGLDSVDVQALLRKAGAVGTAMLGAMRDALFDAIPGLQGVFDAIGRMWDEFMRRIAPPETGIGRGATGGWQTNFGQWRRIPGLPDQGVPILAHGGEIIGRPRVSSAIIPNVGPSNRSFAMNLNTPLVGQVTVTNEADENRLIAKMRVMLEDSLRQASGQGSRYPSGIVRTA